MLAYTAILRGDVMTSNTGSRATGLAHIQIDPQRKLVSLSLDVDGIALNGLWDNLVRAPIGPIHLHLYGGQDHADPSSVSLVFPAPFGPSYASTKTGFQVRVADFSYVEGAGLLRSNVTFEDFLAALDAGRVVVNVHTNAFHDGEISGAVTRDRR